MNIEQTINWIFLLSLMNFWFVFFGSIAIVRKISSLKTNIMKQEKDSKPVHERALNNRFITGLHLALLMDGFEWEPTWHGIKYTGDLVAEGINVFIIFGDWNGAEFDESFIEIQIKKKTLSIEKVKRFHWNHYKDFILKGDYEKYLDLYLNDDD